MGARKAYLLHSQQPSWCPSSNGLPGGNKEVRDQSDSSLSWRALRAPDPSAISAERMTFEGAMQAFTGENSVQPGFWSCLALDNPILCIPTPQVTKLWYSAGCRTAYASRTIAFTGCQQKWIFSHTDHSSQDCGSKKLTQTTN
jgi:hypothetical protein